VTFQSRRDESPVARLATSARRESARKLRAQRGCRQIRRTHSDQPPQAKGDPADGNEEAEKVLRGRVSKRQHQRPRHFLRSNTNEIRANVLRVAPLYLAGINARGRKLRSDKARLLQRGPSPPARITNESLEFRATVPFSCAL